VRLAGLAWLWKSWFSWFGWQPNWGYAADVEHSNVVSQEFIVVLEIVPASDETAAHVGFGDVMTAGPHSIGDPRQALPGSPKS